MNGLGTGRSSHGSGQLWGAALVVASMPLRWGNPSGRGQAPPLRSSAVPRFLTYRPVRRGRYSVSPRRRESASRKPGGSSKKGESQFPLLGRFKGWIVKAGEIGIPALTGFFAPFWPLRRGPAGGMTRKQIQKMVSMEGAPARHKAGRCGQKVNCPRGAREAALGRRPLHWAIRRR